MRRALVLAWISAACAQSIVAGPEDRPTSRREDGGDDGGTSSNLGDARAPDAAPLGPDGDGGPRRDADTIPAADAGGSGGGCARSIAEGVFVPDVSGMAALRDVRALVFAADGRLLVLSRDRAAHTGWVTVLSPAPAHAPITSYGHTTLRDVQDMALDAAGQLHVVEYDPNAFDPPRVHVLDAATGAVIRQWTADGLGQDEATSITFDTAGRAYVGGLVVHRYDAMGRPIDALGLWGNLDGRIGRAYGLAFDPRGFVWVADLARNVVHQMDLADGSHVTELGQRGVGPARFDGNAESDVRWGPTRLDLDRSGALYANDPFVSRVQKLSRQGVFLGELSLGGPTTVGPVRVAPNGNVYVGFGNAVVIFCPL